MSDDFIDQVTASDAGSPDEAIITAQVDTANKLYAAMRRRGITQTAVADILGVNKGWVSRVFSGDENLTIETMVKLATAIGCRFEVALPDAAQTEKYRTRKLLELVETGAWSEVRYPKDDWYVQSSRVRVPSARSVANEDPSGLQAGAA